MATTRYHRWVVMASVIRLLTSWTPTLLAVSKPKVAAPPGSGRSLSMVFGTCATRTPPPAASASRDAENAVSSPPIVTSAPFPSFRSDSRQACSLQSGSAAPESRTVGLAREVRRIDPPWAWILDTSVMNSGRTSSVRPSMRCSKPSMIPTTSHPDFRASIVAAEMTEFIPGAGPPPHRMPSFTRSSFQHRGRCRRQSIHSAGVRMAAHIKHLQPGCLKPRRRERGERPHQLVSKARVFLALVQQVGPVKFDGAHLPDGAAVEPPHVRLDQPGEAGDVARAERL